MEYFYIVLISRRCAEKKIESVLRSGVARGNQRIAICRSIDRSIDRPLFPARFYSRSIHPSIYPVIHSSHRRSRLLFGTSSFMYHSRDLRDVHKRNVLMVLLLLSRDPFPRLRCSPSFFLVFLECPTFPPVSVLNTDLPAVACLPFAID